MGAKFSHIHIGFFKEPVRTFVSLGQRLLGTYQRQIGHLAIIALLAQKPDAGGRHGPWAKL